MSARRPIKTPRTSSTLNCGYCPLREQPAELWCTLCKQGLCSECKVHHRSTGSTKKHEVLPIEEYRKLRHYVSDMKEFCGLHGKKFDHYCVTHNTPCCSICITSKHARCSDIVLIDENLTELRTPKLLSALEERTRQLFSDIQSIRENRKQNIINIEQQRQKIQKEIYSARRKINSFLDKIEHDTLVNLSIVEENQIGELDDVMLQFATIEKNIKHINTYISNIKNFGSDAKTFLATCEMETKLSKEETSLHTLYEDERLKQRDMELKFNPKFASLYAEVKSFGDIVVQKNAVRISSARSRHRAKEDHKPTVTVFGVRKPSCLLRLKRSISIKKGKRDNYITSCAVLPSGKFIFVDCSDKRLIVCHEDGSHNRDIQLPNQPWDLAVIGKQRVAVTIPLDHCILIIDVSSGIAIQKFTLNSQCYGIDFYEGKLVVVFHRDGIKFLDIDGNQEESLPLSVANVWYVAVSNDRIFYSEWNTHTIHCCDRNGKKIWTFKDENLRNPRAITYDDEGHIYVTGRWSNNVIAISPDGKQSKVLLSKAEGLDCPTGLFYEKDKKRLLLCDSFQGSISYYEVSIQGQKSTTCSLS